MKLNLGSPLKGMALYDVAPDYDLQTANRFSRIVGRWIGFNHVRGAIYAQVTKALPG